METKEILLAKTKYAYYCATKLIMSEKQKDEVVDNIESLKSKFNVQTQELTKAYKVEDNKLNSQIATLKDEIIKSHAKVQELERPVEGGFKSVDKNFQEHVTPDLAPINHKMSLGNFWTNTFLVLAIPMAIFVVVVEWHESQPPAHATYTVPIHFREILSWIFVGIILAALLSLIVTPILFPIVYSIKVKRDRRKWATARNKEIDVENKRIEQEIANIKAYNERQKILNVQRNKENLQLIQRILKRIENLEREVKELNKAQTLLNQNKLAAMSVLTIAREKSIIILSENKRKIESAITDLKEIFTTKDVITVSHLPIDHRYDTDYYARMYDVFLTEQATNNGEAIKIVDEQLRDERRDKLLQEQIAVIQETKREIEKSIREVGFGINKTLDTNTQKINKTLNEINKSTQRGVDKVEKTVSHIGDVLNQNMQTLNTTVSNGTELITNAVKENTDAVQDNTATIFLSAAHINSTLEEGNRILESQAQSLRAIDANTMKLNNIRYLYR